MDVERDMQFTIQLFDPKTASQELWNGYFDHYENIFQEVFPDDPMPSRDVIKKSILLPDPNREYHRWIVFSGIDNTVIGYGKLVFHKKTSPEYEANKFIAEADLSVRKKDRQHGIGTELLRHILERAKEEGKITFQSWGIPEISSPFFEHYGGKFASKEEENRLKLTDVDWSMIESWRMEGKKKQLMLN